MPHTPPDSDTASPYALDDVNELRRAFAELLRQRAAALEHRDQLRRDADALRAQGAHVYMTARRRRNR
jgi:hypothetical protein